jgi:D-glucosaminate-specific PTS system IIB component
MDELALVRIDDRLIHGQVVVKWLRHLGCNEVVIVDDDLWTDDSLKSVLRLAAPRGVSLRVVPVDQASSAVKRYQPHALCSADRLAVPSTRAVLPPVTADRTRRILLLIRSPHTALALLDSGLSFHELNVGGLAAGQGTTRVYKSISVTSEQLHILHEINSRGVRVYFQTVPDERALELSELAPMGEGVHETGLHAPH